MLKSILTRLGARGVAIDVRDKPRKVCRQISGCSAIISTSLHGLIVADSYGVPAAWSMLPPTLYGGDFKFLDHESVVLGGSRHRRVVISGDESYDELIQLAEPADLARVRDAVVGLEASIARLREHLPDRISPLRLVRWRGR
ncbi:polysaccharide pyruvyl transferase family protein [Microbacterium esteraromaticum]|uniref:polysaccharide pyruvyl transferase family protein n=1 Tax=Microbacterium esteraromaticum TaxID=57043 RepID=UPI0023682A40|nr:polysaccharide pyruvyl transferase family protein [Microbacterium esteraromaticum]WDH79453.1 polysaccharide pyruvyl transferase family protein [Microbacterium esteraromaticum]